MERACRGLLRSRRPPARILYTFPGKSQNNSTHPAGLPRLRRQRTLPTHADAQHDEQAQGIEEGPESGPDEERHAKARKAEPPFFGAAGRQGAQIATFGDAAVGQARVSAAATAPDP